LKTKSATLVNDRICAARLLPPGCAGDGRGLAGEFPATVRSINPAGPQVKIELITAWGDPAQVDMGHERFRALDLAPGKELFVRPKEEKLFIYHI
jgi:TOBE domain-containing protein